MVLVFWHRKWKYIMVNLKYIIEMKTIFKSIIALCITILFLSCKDEDLLLPKTPYTENELRINGYYYNYPESNKTKICFFYKNGIMLNFISYFSTTNLSIIDDEISEMYEKWKNEKMIWQIFLIQENKIQWSGWSTSVGGGLPTFRCVGNILNDSTFCITKSINSDGAEFDKNEIYHFRQFAPKPDSTNNFIQ